MKSLQDIHKKNQQQRATFALMNQVNNRTQMGWFTPQPSNDLQSPFGNSLSQFSQQTSEHNIIHNTRGTLHSLSQSIERQIQSREIARQVRKQNAQQSARQEKHFFGTINGIPKINSPKTQANQTTSMFQPNLIKVDPKIKRQLSEMSKRNFLHFLLVQKVGQKDEKQFYEYLKKTYNFEPPQPIEEQQIKVSKKGIKYLFTKEDDDETIKKTSQQILRMHKLHHGREVPLDKYVQETYEQQLRRFPKVREKLEQSKKNQLEQS
ncbi:unnamed protein product [Paramecium sonneborni]|uniref:Uncharacterized protein n=1 Tax=Paramecium sonneborni TaxID=65129 RepID=A0A8S1NSN6_9CILI|nr:unnamed protein product [Paramecium sonneborni]